MSNWNNNEIQFARLLSELVAVGVEQETLDRAAESMDLDPFEVQELLARVDERFEEAKEEAENLRHEPYVWTVTIEVHPMWVADGFDLDDDRLEEMMMRELSSATGSEVGGKVLKAPDSKQIRAEQGYKEEGYRPRYEE